MPAQDEPAPTATLGDLLRHGRAKLEAAGCPTPALDARLLLLAATGANHAALISDPGRAVIAESHRRYESMIDRRAAREPVDRILGGRDFHGIFLTLSPDTLSPRGDTEILVDAALGHVGRIAAKTGRCRILDIGTGTGAIALSLLAAEPRVFATGTDIAAGALATAAQNAAMLGLSCRFTLLLSDVFQEVKGEFDLILSNPPYIPTPDIGALMPEVRLFDPSAALDGGIDGLDFYRRIAAGARAHLSPGGRVGLEFGHDQKQAVAAIFGQAGFAVESAHVDLGGNDRVMILR